MGVDATLAIDCLPLTLRDMLPQLKAVEVERRITIGSSALTDTHFLEFIARLLHDPQLGEQYTFDLLLGSRAYMSAEDIAFAERFANTPNTLNVVFAESENEWLQQIARSKLLVSGRFHHSVAATCLQTPFLLFNSNTPKNKALADRLDEYPGDLTSDTKDPTPVLHDALKHPHKYQVSHTLIKQLTSAAELNFPEYPAVPSAINEGLHCSTAQTASANTG